MMVDAPAAPAVPVSELVTIPRDVLVNVVALLRAHGHTDDGVLGDVVRALGDGERVNRGAMVQHAPPES